MLTGEIAAQEIAKQADHEPTTRRVRAMGRRIIFNSITQQMPHLDRKVRRELARQYEHERWLNRGKKDTSDLKNATR